MSFPTMRALRESVECGTEGYRRVLIFRTAFDHYHYLALASPALNKVVHLASKVVHTAIITVPSLLGMV